MCGKGHKIVLTRELEVSAMLKGDARTVHPLQGVGGGAQNVLPSLECGAQQV